MTHIATNREVRDRDSANESLAIVIPSKNRPHDIERVVRSIRAQRTQPDRLIIVDQSNRAYNLSFDNDVVHHYDPHLSGITAARNVGIALNDCAVVLFLDDDVEVTSDVVELVRNALRTHSDAIGVQCEILPPPNRVYVERPGIGAHFWEMWKRIFWRGFFTWQRPAKRKTSELNSMAGGAAAFHARLFERERFDEQLTDYCFGEDWEFCKRARRYGRFFLVRGATLIHHESPVNRYQQRRVVHQRWRNCRYFYDKLASERGPFDRFWLWWWMLSESVIWVRKGLGLPWVAERESEGR